MTKKNPMQYRYLIIAITNIKYNYSLIEKILVVDILEKDKPFS